MQFSIGLGASRDAFISALTREGVPFAILTLLLAGVLFFSNWSPLRIHAFLARLRTTTHPIYLVWGSIFFWLTFVAALVLFLAWGVSTSIAVRPTVVGLGILLLIPAFFIVAWALAAWHATGWSDRAPPRSYISPAIADAVPLLVRSVWRLHVWLFRSSHPLASALICGLLLFTGYELVIIYNGDTITISDANGDNLRQTYVHRLENQRIILCCPLPCMPSITHAAAILRRRGSL